MKTTIYTPEPVLRHPAVLVREMIEGIVASRGLAWRLTVRNISAMYRQTFLGLAWAFFPPLVTTFTFALLSKGGVFNLGDTALPLVAYMLIGTSLWQLFADSMQAPLRVVGQSRAMLAKINFPREALLLSGILETLFNFAIRSSLIVATLIWFRIMPPATIVFVPLGLLALICLGTMIGVLITPIGMLYKDVEKLLPMVMQFFMLLTPVVYAPPTTGPAALLTKYNPVAPVLQTTRDWLTLGHTDSLVPFLVISACSMILLVVGWMLYRISMPHMIARMGG